MGLPEEHGFLIAGGLQRQVDHPWVSIVFALRADSNGCDVFQLSKNR